MKNKWQENINTFIELSTKHQVKMIMVGGGAVNFYGYQRHSADVDFWIDTTTDNLNKLIAVFKEMNYEIEDFPEAVKRQEQNISIKFSPVDLNLELITRFSINKAFEEAYADSEKVEINGEKLLRWNVLSFNDLITSKIKAGRPKDLLDIQQLKQLNNE
ncbi:MAG: nucleotidyltransferase [Bacteroidales bacterium]|nr:nucleotidyltransferase [Bacteroidales bacterium]